MDTDVLVAGAGPTGLMLALELARRGIRVRIVDKLAAPSPTSRALVVHARTLELFQNLGIEREFLRVGLQTIGLSAYVEGRHITDVEFGDIGASATPFPFVLFVSQAETERILEQALRQRGVSVERAVALSAFSHDASGVTATLESADGRRETLRCRYLGGCDGAHSVVRHGLGLNFAGAAYAQDFVLADVRVDWALARDRLMLFLGRRGLMAVFPMPEGVLRLIVAVPQGFSDVTQPLTLAETQKLARHFSATDVTLSDPVWLARFHLHHRGVERYGVGRVFVAGDAAHIHSPAGGQGMNTGIQDAANLAWKLALVINAQATSRVLDSYSHERWPIGRVLLKRTDRFFEVMATGNAFTVSLRNLLVPRLLPLLARYRWLRKRVFRFISQLGIHYRESPVVRERGRWHGGPHAGERAPDAECRRGADTKTLFDAMRGPEHHLLVFTGTSTTADSWQQLASAMPFPCRAIVIRRDAATRNDLTDSAGAAYKLYGVADAGGVYLVRPDGYVGVRAPLADAASVLSDYAAAL